MVAHVVAPQEVAGRAKRKGASKATREVDASHGGQPGGLALLAEKGIQLRLLASGAALLVAASASWRLDPDDSEQTAGLT